MPEDFLPANSGLSGMSGLIGDDLSPPPPDSVANLLAWWSASRGTFSDLGGMVPVTADGEEVKLWMNQMDPAAANGALADPGLLPLLKLNQINGQPALLFSSDAFNLAGPGLLAAPSTVIAVVRTADVSGAPCFVGGTGYSIGLNATGKIALNNAAVEFAAGGTTLSTTDFSIIAVTYSNPDWAVYLNGVADGSGSSAQALGNFDAIGAGNPGPFANGWPGHIADVLVYGAVLSAPDLAIPTNYLKSAYDLV